MRILLDASKVRMGGSIQASLALLTSAARHRSHEWHVAASERVASEVSPRARGAFASFRVMPHGSLVTRTLGHRRLLLRFEREVAPQLVFSIFGPVFWRPSTTHLEGFALPWLIYPHSRAYRWLTRTQRSAQSVRNLLARRHFRRADHLVVETETVRQRVHDFIGISLDRVHVVRNTYSPIFRDSIAGKAAATWDGRHVILVPSSYYVHKNLEVLPRAAAVLKRYLSEPFEFLFTIPVRSQGWQGIAAVAREYGVTGEVRTMGAVPHGAIGDLYRQAQLVCLPTVLECSTAVYPESFAAGVPVVTADMDFAREACGDAAVYFDPFSPGGTARAILRGLTDKAMREQLIEKGKGVLARNYPSPAEKWSEQLSLMESLGQ